MVGASYSIAWSVRRVLEAREKVLRVGVVGVDGGGANQGPGHGRKEARQGVGQRQLRTHGAWFSKFRDGGTGIERGGRVSRKVSPHPYTIPAFFHNTVRLFPMVLP